MTAPPRDPFGSSAVLLGYVIAIPGIAMLIPPPQSGAAHGRAKFRFRRFLAVRCRPDER